MKLVLRAALFAVLALGHSLPVHSQALPSEPISLADGRVTVGGDISASVGFEDPGFFNYTDYEHSALRLFHADLTTAIGMGGHLSVLGELSTDISMLPEFGADTGAQLHAYALYLRIRPWIDRQFDKIGRASCREREERS